MPRGYRSMGAALLAASALMAPELAMAQTAREAASLWDGGAPSVTVIDASGGA